MLVLALHFDYPRPGWILRNFLILQFIAFFNILIFELIVNSGCDLFWQGRWYVTALKVIIVMLVFFGVYVAFNLIYLTVLISILMKFQYFPPSPPSTR